MSDDLLERTERANARRLAAKYGDRLRYVRAWKSWLRWDGKRWCRDQIGYAHAYAKGIADDVAAEATALFTQANDATGDHAEELKDQAAATWKWAAQSCSRRVIEATVALAETEPGIAAPPEQFDRDPMLITVDNGTIDLRTGVLRPHAQGDYITQLAPVPYDPAATCPTWDKFVEWALPDEETRLWMQKFFGHCLTGDVGEQIVTFLHGGGANGKSTMLGAVKHVLGDYAMQGEPGLIISAEHGDGEALARRLRADLHGRRLVLVQETDAGRYLSEAQVKALSGGDAIRGAHVFERAAEFLPTHKMVIGMNYKPTVRGQDDGIWRRLRLVPFTERISDELKDPALPAKFRAEASGILAYLVRGCIEWQSKGLAPSRLMREAVAKYKSDEDRLAEFIEDTCVIGTGEEFVVDGKILYQHYKTWAGSHSEKNWSQRAFTTAMEERGRDRGFTYGRPTIAKKQVRGFVGIRLNGSSGTTRVAAA